MKGKTPGTKRYWASFVLVLNSNRAFVSFCGPGNPGECINMILKNEITKVGKLYQLKVLIFGFDYFFN